MNGLAGTGALTRLALRRDRIILPLWALVVALFPMSVASSFKSLYTDPKQLADFAHQMQATPAIVGFYGPVYGDTLGALAAWRSGILLVIGALAAGLTVIRHTRAEEEQGRRELLGATAVGRQAPLAAAFLLTGAASVIIGLLLWGGISSVAPGAGALAMGVQYIVCLWFFAAVAGVAAQVTQSARTARWILGAVLGGSFLLRAAGDAGGSQDSPLSWISPLGFLQRIRPYGGERWWIAAVGAAVAIGVALWAYSLSSQRDLDAGLVAPRPGPARASRLLTGPLGLTWRLQRGTLIGWAVGFAVLSLVLGSAANSAGDAVKESPQLADIFRRLGGAGALGDLFMVTLISIAAIAAAAQGIQTALRARAEEQAGRVEPVLAAAVGRTRWWGWWIGFALGGPALSLVVLGLCGGISYGAGGDGVGRQLPRVLGAALAVLPAVWLTVGIVVALFGLLPRLVAAGWVLLAAFLLLGQLGAVLQLPQWALDLSPFSHVPHLPGGTLSWPPLIWLAVLAALLTGAGVWGFRRRDIG
ncbi:ABC transporter permease [Hamadaea tsunoensis]|uniref:ABC transporter permease n=1 Tax=Hamadaea tsunoensis TaxID=53368 RepID=UPI00042625D2|nr:ABC transporter permease [Hamadaea tsunoensis]